MSKKVLILSGSPRKNGNSELLCEEFKRGAQEAGHHVEKIFIREKKIGYCVACQFCKKDGYSGPCAFKDDMEEILQKMKEADAIALGSPVYFYGIDAQMKTVIDRTYASWLELKNKELYYIITCLDNEDEVIESALANFNGWEVCLPKPIRKGVIYGKGVGAPGAVKDKSYMQQAYEMGKNV